MSPYPPSHYVPSQTFWPNRYAPSVLFPRRYIVPVLKHVIVTGQLAYRFNVINVEDKTAPFLEGSLGFDRYVWMCITHSAERAFCTPTDQIATVDITDKSAPALTNIFTDPLLYIGEADVGVIKDNLLYAPSLHTQDRLLILDITNPDSPTMIGYTPTDARLDNVYGVDVVGNYAYCAAAASDYFTIVDVSDPTAPAIVGAVTATSLDHAIGVKVREAEDYAFVTARYANCLNVIDVTDKTAPTIVTTFTSPQFGSPCWLDRVGDLLYMPNHLADSLVIIDVSDPFSPTQVGYITDATLLNYALKAKVHDHYCYVTATVANRLVIIDVSDPTSPTIVGSVTAAELDDTRGLDIVPP